MNALQRTALHEAGHALAAVLLGGKVLEIRIRRTSPTRYLGWTDSTLPIVVSPMGVAITCMAGLAVVRGELPPDGDIQAAAALVGSDGVRTALDRATALLAGRGATLAAIAGALLDAPDWTLHALDELVPAP